MKNIINKLSNSKLARIALTIFVLFAVVGFAYPLLANGAPFFTGISLGNKLVTAGATDPLAIADADFLEGGHMQVPTHGALLGFPSYPGSGIATTTSVVYITPQRRRVGMLVTVLDDTITGTSTSATTIGQHTVTYRLVTNPDNTAGCPSVGTAYHDQSIDGTSLGCNYTQDANWKVVIPYLDPSLTNYFLGNDGSGNVALYPAPSGSGTSTTFVLGNGATSSSNPATLVTGGGYSTLTLLVASSTQAGFLSAADYGSFASRMLGANNLSEITSTSSARANLGLGSIAVYTATSFLSVPNLIGGVYVSGSSTSPFWEIASLGSSAQADARVNLGLGGLAVLGSIDASSTSLTGILPAIKGGTGQNVYAVGDILYANATSTLARLTIGTTGQILTVNSSGLPVWANLSGSNILYDGTRLVTRANIGVATGTAIGGTTLQAFLDNYFFPSSISSYIIVATSSATSTYSIPAITFTFPASGSSTTPYCTGTSGTITCEKIDSSHVTLFPTVTTTPGNTTLNTMQHRWAVWSDGSTSTTATYGVHTTDQGDGTNSALNNIVSVSGGADNGISNVLLKTSVSGSPFCGLTAPGYTTITTSPCSVSIVSSGQTLTGGSGTGTSISSTGGGATTTYQAEVTDLGGTTQSTANTISFASRYYIFLSNYDYYKNPSAKTAAQIGTDFYNLASTCASGTGCTTGFMTSTSTGLRTINFTNTGGNYMYYAFPSSFGTLTGSIQDCHGGSGCTALSDSGWVLGTSASGGSTTVSLTNSHGGYTENYNLYSYQWDGAATTLSTPTSDAWKVIFPW